jgi:hypothetical protein
MSDREDAERWRAIMSSERIVYLGAARDRADHVAFEFWGKAATTPARNVATNSAKQLLTKYADDRRKEGYR